MIKDLAKSHKKIVFIFLPIFVVSVYASIYIILRKLDISKESVDEVISSFGIYAILGAYIIQLAISLTPIPDSTAMFPILFFFGPILGILPIVLGIQTASFIHYSIAKKLGKEYIFAKFPQTQSYAEKFSNDISIEMLIIARVFALVSFDIVAYMAGISNVPKSKFIIGGTLALIPIILPNALITIGLFTTNPIQLVIVWSLTLISVLSLAYFAKKSPLRKKFFSNT